MRRSAAAVIVLAATLALAAVTSPLAGAKPRGPTARAWVALDAGTGTCCFRSARTSAGRSHR